MIIQLSQRVCKIKKNIEYPSSNFAKRILENSNKITFNINNELDIFNTQHNIYISSVLEELHIYIGISSIIRLCPCIVLNGNVIHILIYV